MSDNKIKLPNGMELVFAPGCFDSFEGTQEELDELVKEITESFISGEALTEAKSISDLSEEEIEEILEQLGDDDTPTRTLQ
jgi:hypothetical protein